MCETCQIYFDNAAQWRHHEVSRQHLKVASDRLKHLENEDYSIIKGKSAFKNRAATVIFFNKNPEFTIDQFCKKIENSFVKVLESHFGKSSAIKVNCNFYTNYKKITGEEQLFNLNTSCVTFFKKDNILEKIETEIFPQIDVQNDELNNGGSGWIYNSVLEMELRINRVDLMTFTPKRHKP